MSRDAYRDAGVDIDAGDDLVERIKPHARRTMRPGVMGGLGSFGGLFSLKGYRDPVLVSGTDGVAPSSSSRSAWVGTPRSASIWWRCASTTSR